MLNKTLDYLERKLGKYAIRGLMTYIIIGNAAVFLLNWMMPAWNLRSKLILVPSLVLQGEVWRIFTYIFIPPSASIFFIFFVLYFYYMIGNGLEHQWGSFRFNAYYFTGILGTAAAAMFTGYSDATYLNLSLFLAFAYLFPNFEILLFFILPVKMKYLAWLNWAFFGFTLLFGALPLKIATLVSMGNYFLFFGRDHFKSMKNKKSVHSNRKNYQKQIEEGLRANKENMKNRNQ